MMKTIKAWVHYFNIADIDLDAWTRKVPQGNSLTFWCLDNHKIPEDKYFEWARNMYSLSSINDDFFNLAPNTELWEKVKSKAAWSIDHFPILEWDGTLFVVCLEPQENVNLNFPVQYLLASPKSLKKYWYQLQPPAAANVIPLKGATAAPAPLSPPDMPAPPIKVAPPAPVQAPPSNIEKPKLDEPQLAGLTLDLKDLGGSTELNPIPELEIPSSDLDEPALEGLVDLKLKGKDEPQGLSLQGLTLDLPDDPVTSTNNSILVNTQMTTAQPDPTIANMNLTLENTPSKEINDSKSKPAETTGNPGGVSAQFDQVLLKAFKDLKTKFRNVMLITFKGDKMLPYKWDEDWKPSADAVAEYDTNQPSIFRIVKRSQLPFHGQVVSSPLNDDFFKKWNYPTLPAHATLIPIKTGAEKTVGMILAVGDLHLFEPGALLFAEKIINKLIEANTEEIKKFAA